MRISKKVRKEAAVVASIAACTGNNAADCFMNEPAYNLYWLAWHAVCDAFNEQGIDWMYYDSVLDAEAESLLRCGWSPGDEL